VTTRVAAIDCGTNSIRLLIADIRATADNPERVPGALVRPARRAPLADVRREMRIVRLGEGVGQDRTAVRAALDRHHDALREYAE